MVVTGNNKLRKQIITLFTNTVLKLFKWKYNENCTVFRSKIIIFSFCALFFIIAINLILVSTSSQKSKIFQEKKHEKLRYIRNNIVDRNGQLLATDIPMVSLYANPDKVIDPKKSIQKLSVIFPDLDQDYLILQLSSKKNFVWIKRCITPKDQQEVYNLGLLGFDFIPEQKRFYLYNTLLSHVLGYVGLDMEGLAGVEKYFNTFLTIKKDDNEENHSDLVSRYNRFLSLKNYLQLSLDIRVQNILSEEIDHVIKKFHAKGGAGIIVDSTNGEIIALVSKPDFDPHFPGKASPNQLFNMITQGVYEMGSIMKVLTIAIGIDTNITSPYDLYDITYMKVNNFQIRDHHQKKGWHSVPEIFLQSSNIGVSQIILEIGKNNFYQYFKNLLLLDQLKIELPERAKPLYPDLSRWTDLSLVTMSYGYGISESPAHFIQAMIPVVNGGKMYPLTIIKDSNNNSNYHQVFSSETSMIMRKLLRLVVSKGTGQKAEIPGYYIGGKTGTANKAIAGKYNKDKRLSSFFAVIPASNPKYIVYVIINEPQGIKETAGFSGGGWTAAPAVQNILSRMIGLYSIEPLNPNSSEVLNLLDIETKMK